MRWRDRTAVVQVTTGEEYSVVAVKERKVAVQFRVLVNDVLVYAGGAKRMRLERGGVRGGALGGDVYVRGAACVAGVGDATAGREVWRCSGWSAAMRYEQ